MLPDNLNEWLAALSGLITFGGIIFGFFFKLGKLAQSTEDRFKQQGERLGQVELEAKGCATSVEELRRKDQAHEFQMLSLTKDQGEIEGKLTQLLSMLEKQGELKNLKEIEIAERLARIEERLDIFIKMQGIRNHHP